LSGSNCRHKYNALDGNNTRENCLVSSTKLVF
jgi:hypothetical protein